MRLRDLRGLWGLKDQPVSFYSGSMGKLMEGCEQRNGMIGLLKRLPLDAVL